MFSDRGWILKVLVGLLLLAWLVANARRRLAEEYPDVERLTVFTEDLRGRQFFLWGRRVQAVDPTGIQIDSQAGPIHILTPNPPAVGQYVSVLARASGPRTLEAVNLRVNEGYVWKRPLNYVISALTVLAYLWIVRRRFRWRVQEGVFRGRY